MWARMRLTVLRWLGSIANLAGIPGLVRDGIYDSPATDTHVTVRRSAYFTVVTVNGVQVYFNRLSGCLDGTAVSRTSDCTLDETPQSVRSVEPLSPLTNTSHN